jgi:copper chaperone CopZ
VKFVTFHVKDMHCPHACWPEVKKSLEAQEGVELVELAKQTKEDEIDNPTVFVKWQGQFDAVAAIAELKKIGFTGQAIDPKESL